MPINQVSIVRKCSVCATEIETVSVKKDNMMLASKALVWCPRLRSRAARAARHRRARRVNPTGAGLVSPSQLAVPFGAPPVR